MRAVMPEALPDVVAMRRQTGADRWDEMWEGELHMPPMPSFDHQDFEWALETWLRIHWGRPRGNKVYHQINLASLGGWPNNYRIPDLVLLTPNRFDINQGLYFEGPPTVAVEIRSPGDEAFNKLPFYAKLGVPETWIIDRDTKEVHLYVLRDSRYEQQSAGADGWYLSEATGIEIRCEPEGKLAIQIAGAPETRELLPED